MAARNKPRVFFPAALTALLLLALLSLAVGPAGLRPPPPLGPLDPVARLRLYRTLLAAATGALLGLAGALTQYATSNPLAAPTILGIPQGALAAAAAALLATASGSTTAPGVYAAAAIGGLAAYAATAALAARLGFTAEALVVAGVAVSSAATGAAGLLLLAAQARTGVVTPLLLLGTFAYATPRDAATTLAAAAAALTASLPMARGLDALSYGDTVAATTGYSPRLVRAAAASLAAAAVAATIPTAGLIGFIGLIAPNAARGLAGAHPRTAIPASTILGAVVALAADTAARLAAPLLGLGELPAGTATSLIGGAFLAYMLAARKH